MNFFLFERYYNKWNGKTASRDTQKRVPGRQGTSTETPPRKTTNGPKVRKHQGLLVQAQKGTHEELPPIEVVIKY